MLDSKRIIYKGAIYVEALSSEPLRRALERIDDLKRRGADPRSGTIKRLVMTEDPGKIAGIYHAAKKMKWEDVAKMAAKKYKDIVGTRIPPLLH